MSNASAKLPPLWRSTPHPGSSRGFPLLLTRCTSGTTVVTVEATEKWYGIHTVCFAFDRWHIVEIAFPDVGDHDNIGPPHVDHAPNPAHVVRWARRNGYHPDTLAVEAMLGRWVLATSGTGSPLAAVMREIRGDERCGEP